MAMNPPTYPALKRLAQLIDSKLKTNTNQEVIDEIKAWNRLLKRHIGQQKKQPSPWKNHRYEYDKNTKKIRRLNKNGEIVAEY